MLELDNSRIKDFKKCPRYYYFRHVRHWVQEGPMSPAVTFGTCWSAAMDSLWVHKTVDAGMGGFMKAWFDNGLNSSLPLAAQKTWQHHNPDTAKKMLTNYWTKYNRLISGVKVLAADVCFAVPLMDGVDYLAKPDKVVETADGDVWVVDHKTTGYGGTGGFTFAWTESWHLSSQIDGYKWAVEQQTHEPVTITIDAALVNKQHHNVFEMLPIRKQPDWKGHWEDDAIYWVKQIQREEYPRNTESCKAFNRLCEYFDICRWASKPLEVDMPKGFVEKVWDPKV